MAFVMIPTFLKLNYRTGSFLSKLKQVDWPGSFLFIASATSFLIPLTWGGVMYPWNHWKTILPLILGVVGVAIFIVYSKLTPLDPLIRGSIFQRRTASISCFGTVIQGTIVSFPLSGNFPSHL